MSRVTIYFLLIATLPFQTALGTENPLVLPTILTPARLSLPRAQTPASVTVLDSDLIEASGIRELPELFRLVPGVSVGSRDGWNYAVSYHGTNYRDSRRMQVLVDGRSIYQPGLATIDWSDLPLAIQDIEQIEIVRGPDTAAYGANAFLGVINITTKNPVDSPRYRMSGRAGSESVEDYYASTSIPAGEGFLKVTAAARRDNGFDKNDAGQKRRDHKNLEFIHGHYELKRNRTNYALQAGFKQGEVGEDIFDETMVIPPSREIREYFTTTAIKHFPNPNRSIDIQFDWQRQEERTDWISCLDPALLGFTTTPIDETCGDVDEDINSEIMDFDIQDSWFGNENRWQWVYGLHLKRKYVDSQTFYGGSISRSSYQVFSTLSVQLIEKLRATLGATHEYEETNGKHVSPRLALNYQVAANHSLRYVVSKAIRTPDIFETQANWTYTARNLRPRINGASRGEFIFTAQGIPGLTEERVIAREFGYYGLIRNHDLSIDIKIFHDSYSNLISENLSLLEFEIDNANSLTQRGFEVEVDWALSPSLRFRSTYAHIDSATSATSATKEINFTPDHSHSVMLDYRINDLWRFSVFHYYSKPQNKQTFNRTDFRVARDFHWQGWSWQLSTSLQYRRDSDGDLFKDNRYDNKTRFQISIDTQY